MRRVIFVVLALFTLCFTASLGVASSAHATVSSGKTSSAHTTAILKNTSSVPVAVSLKKHTVKVVPGPKSYCEALIKKYPKLASNPHGCDITIESDTWFSPSIGSQKSSSVHPNSCYSGAITHTATYIGPFYLFHATLFSTFHYNNCNTPSADQPNCTRDNFAALPYTGVNATACYSGSSGSDVYAEGNWSAGGPVVPTTSFSVQSIAGAGTTTIRDYFHSN